jgi:hypothetical protein
MHDEFDVTKTFRTIFTQNNPNFKIIQAAELTSLYLNSK